MKRLLAALVLVTMPMTPAHADGSPKTLNGCDGVYSGTYNHVIVKKGQDCILTQEAVVVGDVKAWRANSLTIYTQVQGGLRVWRSGIVRYEPLECNTPGEYVSARDLVVKDSNRVVFDCVKTRGEVRLINNKHVKVTS